MQQQSLNGTASSRRRPLRNRGSRPVSTTTPRTATPWTCWEEFDHVGRDLLQALSLLRVHRHHHDDDRHSSSSSGPPSTSPTAQRRTTETEHVNGGSAATAAVGAAERSEDPQQHGREKEEEKVDGDLHRQPDTVVVRQALDQVEIWWVRAGGPGSLPHAVESTHALALCLHTDYYHQGMSELSSSSASSFSLSLMYASSITRTVNGFTDVLQQSRAVASSVAHLAHLLGMPGWVVDIRHQSTHNALPSLPLLRTAAQTLLLYLDQVYWSPLRQRRLQYAEIGRQLLLEPPTQPQPITKQQDGSGAQETLFDDDIGDDFDEDDVGRDESGVDGSDGDDQGESDGESGDELVPSPSRSVAAVPHKVLGTTFNRFAALLDDTASKKDKKAKKKKEAASDVTSTEVEPPTARRGIDPAIAEPADDSSPSHAKSTRAAATAVMTWNDVPLDVTYRAAADHVVQYCRQVGEAPPTAPNVALTNVPSELTAFVGLARRHPGLLSFVTNELELLENSRTSDEAADSETAEQTSVFPGRAWAEYLSHLVAHCEPSRKTGTAAPSKRPRHEASTPANSNVHDTAASILRRYGSGVGAKLRSPINSDESTSQTICLEEMEAFLNKASTGGERDVAAPSQGSAAMNGSTTEECGATKTAVPTLAGSGSGGWSLCESWEPCAIGSLGRNVMKHCGL